MRFCAKVFAVVDKVLTAGKKVVRLGDWFGLTQEELGDLLGVKRGTISAYKARNNANPETEKLRALAEKVGVPVSWFLNGEDSDPPVSRSLDEAMARAKEGSAEMLPADAFTKFMKHFATNSQVALPVWRGVTAGYEGECGFTEDHYEPPEAVPGFFITGDNPEKFVVCLPSGVSMAPRIVQGDRVIARLTSDPEPNTIVIARRPDGVNFIKVYRLANDRIPELHSLNGDFPAISPLNEWTIRALVVGIWKPYLIKELNIEFAGGVPLRG